MITNKLDYLFDISKKSQTKLAKRIVIIGIIGVFGILSFFSLGLNFIMSIPTAIVFVFIMYAIYIIIYQHMNKKFKLESIKLLINETPYDAVHMINKKINNEIISDSDFMKVKKRYLFNSYNFIDCKVDNVLFEALDLVIFFYAGSRKKVVSEVYTGRFFNFSNIKSDDEFVIRREINMFSLINKPDYSSNEIIDDVNVYGTGSKKMILEIVKLVKNSNEEISISFNKKGITMAIVKENKELDLADITTADAIRRNYIKEMNIASKFVKIIKDIKK